MRKKENDKHIEVKAVVTEVIDSKTDYIYAGGLHRNWERERWLERRQEMRERHYNSLAYRRPMFLEEMEDQQELDAILPKKDYYAEYTEKVRVRYTVGRQVYEKETVLSDTDNACFAGKKIYLTIDPARPEEILEVSFYKSWGLGDSLFIAGMFALVVIFCAVWFMWCQYQL